MPAILHACPLLLYCACTSEKLFPQIVPVRSKDFSVAFTGMSQYFKCENSKHGKVVVPEGMVLTQIEAIEMKSQTKKQDLSVPSQQHANLHHNIKQPETEKQPLPTGTAGHAHPTTNPQLQRPHSHDQSRASNFEKKDHIYDSISENKGGFHHSNSAGNLLNQSNDQAQEAMLRKALGGTNDVDVAQQERMIKKFNQQRDEQRKADISASRNPPGSDTSHMGNESSVDPLDKNPSKHYQNVLDVNTRAYAPSPQTHLAPKFAMNSQVQFNNPPRYGVIRWMGNLPQVDGLIAGVELVSIVSIYMPWCPLVVWFTTTVLVMWPL